MKPDEAALEVDGLRKRYGSFELDGVGFSLPRGEVMGLVGPNGAGKTTTIRLVMGLARPDAGGARIFGRDPREDRSVLGNVGFLYEDCRFYGSLSALDNSRIVGGAYPAWDEARFLAMLASQKVDAGKKADDLSAGQRNKLALAIALAHDPELLVLDEPTSGLDPVSRSELLDVLYEFIADGRRSVLFSTHITSDLERIADRVTFLREGRVVFSEETGELLGRYSIVKGPVSAIPAARPYLEGIRETGTGFEALGRTAPELSGIAGLVFEKASLDDIVVYSTREDYRVRASA
jgi:ABC-2 type transport system ATP-binding protein